MLKPYYFLLFFAAIFLVYSCDSLQKNNFISSFNTFISNTEMNYKNFNDKDWEEADFKYKNFVEIEYKKYYTKFSDDENKQVNILIGKYQALKLKSSITEVKNTILNKIEQVKTIVNEVAADTTLIK